MKLLLVLIIYYSILLNYIKCEPIIFNVNSISNSNNNDTQFIYWDNKNNWLPDVKVPNENDIIIIDSIPKPIVSNTLDSIIGGSILLNNSSLTINSLESIKSEKILSNVILENQSYLIINLYNNGNNYTINNITCNNNNNNNNNNSNYININNDNKIIIKDSILSNVKITTNNIFIIGYNVISSFEWEQQNNSEYGIMTSSSTESFLILNGTNKNQFIFNGGKFIIKNRVSIIDANIISKNKDIAIIEWSSVEIQDSLINSNIDISNSSTLSLIGNCQINGDLIFTGTTLMSSSTQKNNHSIFDIKNGRPQLYLGPAFKSLTSSKQIKIELSDIYITKELQLNKTLIQSNDSISIINSIIYIDLTVHPEIDQPYPIFTSNKQLNVSSLQIGSMSIDGNRLVNGSYKFNLYNNITDQTLTFTVTYFANSSIIITDGGSSNDSDDGSLPNMYSSSSSNDINNGSSTDHIIISQPNNSNKLLFNINFYILIIISIILQII